VKILHVDDDVIQLKLVSEFFEIFEPSFQTTAVTTPNEAIKLLKKEHFDCVVTDYNMPDINGIEFARRVRQEFRTPIILYTGQGSEEVAERAFEVGIDDYFRKEIDPSHYHVLIKRIKSVVEKNHTEELYYNVVEDARDALCIILDGKIIFKNASIDSLLNEKNDNLIGKKIENYIIKKDVQSYLDWHEKENIKSGYDLKTFRFKKKNNELIEVEISKSDILWHGRKAKILYLRDISYRKKIESEKKISDERFKNLVEIAPDGVMSLSVFGFVTFVNDTFCKLTGFTKDELIGAHVSKLPTLRGKDIPKYVKVFAQIIRGNIPPPFDFNWKRKDGRDAVGEALISLIEVGGKKEILLIARDVTEKRAQEEEYRVLYEYSPNGIIKIDNNNKIVSINQEIIKITGYNKNDLIDKEINNTDIFKNIDINVNKKSLLNYENHDPREYKIIKKDLQEIWIEIFMSEILIHGLSMGSQLIIRDITERKNDEELKRKYAENLEQLIEERTNEILQNERMVAAGQVASMIGHDIRNPLQTIKNLVHIIKLGNQPTEKMLDLIEDSVNLAIKLLEEFKMQTKTSLLKTEYLNIGDIINSSLDPLSINKNIKIEKNIVENLPKIHIDPLMFRRVFDNLFKNAVEAMPDGGILKVDVSMEKGKLIIKVADTGHGIPPEFMKKIFQPFQTTKEKGIGLGLLYCKNTIESHGGTISVSSELNVGTIFTIALPIHKIKDEPIISSPLISNK
jgi:PAS domain S-box-containing protein